MATASGSKVNIFVCYNGVWEVDNNYWIFKDAESSSIPIEKVVTYLQLNDILFEALEIDKMEYDLKLEVPYTMDGQPFKPVHIKKDFHVTVFMEETLKKRIPLCVTLVKKNVIVEGRTSLQRKTSVDPARLCARETQGYVPETDSIATMQVDLPTGGHTLFPEGVDVTNYPSYEYDPYVNDHPVANLCNDNGDIAENGLRSQKLDVQPHSPRGGENNHEENAPLLNSVEDHTPSGGQGEFYLEQTFEDKTELKTKAALYAMKNKFEYQVKKSGTDVWYITCKASNCKWRLRGKKLKGSCMFEITSYHGEHSCSLNVGPKNHRQAAPWLIGQLIKDKYASEGTNYLANDIRGDMKKDFGIDMSYERAWRCREKALLYLRGTVENPENPENNSMKLEGCLMKRPRGRPKRKRVASTREVPVKIRRCSRCGANGHNKLSCKAVSLNIVES